jgi:nicotinate-nucleotide--dimethylbenzimidazole phosphoribosyltransferase
VLEAAGPDAYDVKLAPILNLGMHLGEGTGGALAMNVIEAAIKVLTEVMTFEEAQVPGKE